MVRLVATETEPLPSGVYAARLFSLDEKESTLANETEPQPYNSWKFVILDDEYKDRFVWGNTSTNFTPKSKARGWAEVLLGRTIKTGEAITERDLIGKDCVLSIGVELDKEGTLRNKLLALTPARK